MSATRIVLPLTMLSLCLLPMTAASELPQTQPAGTATILTLEQALAIAAEKNRDIQRALEYRKQLQGRILEERSAALPRLSVSAASVRTRDDIQAKFIPEFPAQQDALSVQVGLSQAVFTWGQTGAAIRAARIASDASNDQLRIHQRAVTRDVSAAFFDLLLAKELKVIAAQNVELRQRHLEAAQRKARAGTATDYDIVAAEVAVANAWPELIKNGNLVQTMREKLAFLLGSAHLDFDVAGNLAMDRRPVPGLQDIVRAAYESRPEIAELAHRRDIALEAVKIVRADGKPRLDFSAQFGRRELSAGDLGIGGNYFSAGLVLTFPFFDGFRTKGKIVSAQSDVRIIEIELARLRDSIALEVQMALDAVGEADEIMKALSCTAGQAEKLLFMAENGYEFGVKTNLDVRDAQMNLMAARGSLARAERDYRVAWLNLEWVSGTTWIY